MCGLLARCVTIFQDVWPTIVQPQLSKLTWTRKNVRIIKCSTNQGCLLMYAYMQGLKWNAWIIECLNNRSLDNRGVTVSGTYMYLTGMVFALYTVVLLCCQQAGCVAYWQGMWTSCHADSVMPRWGTQHNGRVAAYWPDMSPLQQGVGLTVKVYTLLVWHATYWKGAYSTILQEHSLETLSSFITRELNIIWRWNLQLTSLAEVQKALEEHGCKLSVTNLSIIPYTLSILTANVTCFY